MKRHPCLRQLSDDHHRGLVLARRLRRLADAGSTIDLAALASEVRREFAAQLEPHFGVEERWLLPALDTAGAGALVERTRVEHRRLRELVHATWHRGTPGDLGTLLERHVRFEERVLFPRAEALLSEGELAAIRRAAETSRREIRAPRR